MRKVTGQQAVKVNADRKVVETVEELIAIYKREFGDDWQTVFKETVSVSPAHS
jgi:hypothetical protein